jgi:hypothetical protein
MNDMNTLYVKRIAPKNLYCVVFISIEDNIANTLSLLEWQPKYDNCWSVSETWHFFCSFAIASVIARPRGELESLGCYQTSVHTFRDLVKTTLSWMVGGGETGGDVQACGCDAPVRFNIDMHSSSGTSHSVIGTAPTPLPDLQGDFGQWPSVSSYEFDDGSIGNEWRVDGERPGSIRLSRSIYTYARQTRLKHEQ